MLAYRLAEAGKSVCVLERGKPYPPGSFPRSPRELGKAFWDPSEGLYGMFNLWSFKGIGSLVSSGLGGGSLIYANVLLRKDEKWFVQEDLAAGGYEHWPVTRAELDPHYDAVEKMLNAQRYPFEHEPFDRSSKTAAFREAAGKLDREWILPPLAVTFANKGEDPAVGVPIREEHPNLHGLPRYTCRLTGECDIGCNFGVEEHARLQLPLRGEAARCRDLDPPRGALLRAARGRRLRRALRRARRRRRGTEDRHAQPGRAAGARADLRPPRALGRVARLDLPAPQEQPQLPGAEPASRLAVRRQRRPADLRAQGELSGRLAASARRGVRPRDHERDPGSRRARRRRGARLLRRGRRLSRSS